MSKAIFAVLLAAASILPLTAHADTIDDFLLTGNGETITFSLPASPPGNLSTCPTGIISACLPGSQTDFSVFALVTNNGVTAMRGIDFPTEIFGGGLSLGLDPGRLTGDTLFTNNAAYPTFRTGTFSLSQLSAGQPPYLDYSLTITPETSTVVTPEPSTFALFASGAFGLLALARSKRRLQGRELRLAEVHRQPGKSCHRARIASSSKRRLS
jgi:PEP-CTERM motif